jgi:hypothetical protein
MAVTARRIFVPSLIAMLACTAMASAAPRRSLDRARIHGLYHDGEFEKVLRELEAYGKGQCTCLRDDSLFAEKHLAVVLAANPATRELGRYHMFRLLDLSPRADLLDMYVGDEVDAVFDKARKEHDLRAKDPIGKASVPAPAQRPAKAAPAGKAEPAPNVTNALTARSAAPAPVAAAPAPASAAAAPAYSDAWAHLPPVPAVIDAHPVRIAKSRRPADARATYAQNFAHPRSPGSPSRLGSASAQAEPYRPWDVVPAIRTEAAGKSQAKSIATGISRAPGVGDSALRPAPMPAVARDASVRPASRSEAASADAHLAQGEALPARSTADSARPAWKEPGLWIGGGAAFAAIAFTLWHAGSDGGSPGKTYAVPANLAK